MILLKLFWEFFQTGLFAIGGGMATVPFLQDISAKTGWYTAGQLADMIAVSESTPGPLGVNMATYVGYTVGSEQLGGPVMGIVAAIVATIGLILPSIVIIMIIAYFLKKFRESKVVDAALYGLRPASVALISAAGVEIVLFALLGAKNVYEILAAVTAGLDWLSLCKALALAALVYVGTNRVKKLKKLHPIWFIVFSAVVGVVLQMG